MAAGNYHGVYIEPAYADEILQLSDEEQEELLRALVIDSKGWELNIDDLSPAVRVLFRLIRNENKEILCHRRMLGESEWKRIF